MKTKMPFCLILFISLLNTGYGQEKRVFSFNQSDVIYYSLFKMPTTFKNFTNHDAKFIIVDEDNNLFETVQSNTISMDGIERKDQAIHYYLKFPDFRKEKQNLKFLKALIEDGYNRDFFNRNTLSVEFQYNEVPFSCESLDDLHDDIAKIIVPETNNLLKCDYPFVVSENNQGRKLRTAINYHPTTTKESERQRENYKVISQLHNWESTYFISLTYGNHFIDNRFITDFDEETLVDISEENTIWHLTSGHMFANKIGGLLSLGFMSSKKQTRNSNGISISGSGNGFAVLKLGIGARYIPFSRKNWSIYGDVEGGRLSVRAEGGTGSVTITNLGISTNRDISEGRDRSFYWGLTLGANYRLGGVVFLSSNFKYTASNFKDNIGSISGFTGYNFNVGIGFSFR